jgi:hypothetical protein
MIRNVITMEPVEIVSWMRILWRPLSRAAALRWGQIGARGMEDGSESEGGMAKI